MGFQIAKRSEHIVSCPVPTRHTLNKFKYNDKRLQDTKNVVQHSQLYQTITSSFHKMNKKCSKKMSIKDHHHE